jgi:hypothetical protein
MMPSKLMSATETLVEKMFECTISVIEAFVFIAECLRTSVHNRQDFFVMNTIFA